MISCSTQSVVQNLDCAAVDDGSLSCDPFLELELRLPDGSEVS